MNLPARVHIVEVGPRDGLQNESAVLPTAVKARFIDRLAGAGLRVIEATSFVSPRWIPQLADAADVLASVHREPEVRYPVLVPNEPGLARALAAGAEEVAVFPAASETFSVRNLGRSIDDSLDMFRPVVAGARAAGLRARGYVATAFGCPYEGPVAVDAVVALVASLDELGCDEISIADTIGVATAGQVQDLVAALAAEVDVTRLAVHMHDTYGQGLANTLAALEAGVTIADTSAGGLGGCPYAVGAKGNLATEDLVYALHGCGVETGVDLEALVDTTAWIHGHLERPPASRTAEAILARRSASRD